MEEILKGVISSEILNTVCKEPMGHFYHICSVNIGLVTNKFIYVQTLYSWYYLNMLASKMEGFGLDYQQFWDFPGGSDGKQSTCNAGGARDSGSVPGLARSPGEGNGNLL